MEIRPQEEKKGAFESGNPETRREREEQEETGVLLYSAGMV